MQFNDLGLIAPLLNSLQEEGYTQPTPIQEQSIPLVLQGKDLLACAQTGTGKTAAFTLPVLQGLNAQPSKPGTRPIRALILTPTRELAIQIHESCLAYGRHLPLRSTVIFGGVNQHAQVQSLRNGTDILIATPGRLLDLVQQQYVRLNALEYFVLDEADRMLDMGFIHDVKKIIALIPAKRQSLFFSATMPPEIQKLADTILRSPAKVAVHPVSSTTELVQQKILFVDKGNKIPLLMHLLEDKKLDSVLVFTRTKHGADKVAKTLYRHHIKAEAIHGNKSQNARQNALNNFKNRSTRVLVATDIAARGIDVDDLAYVVNFELPNVPETYVHRIGRTGRAGAEGTAFSFCEKEERAYLRDIEQLIKKRIPVVEGHPFPYGSALVMPTQERSQEDRPKQERPRQEFRKSANRPDDRRNTSTNSTGTPAFKERVAQPVAARNQQEDRGQFRKKTTGKPVPGRKPEQRQGQDNRPPAIATSGASSRSSQTPGRSTPGLDRKKKWPLG